VVSNRARLAVATQNENVLARGILTHSVDHTSHVLVTVVKDDVGTLHQACLVEGAGVSVGGVRDLGECLLELQQVRP